MTESSEASLLGLQKLDRRVSDAEARIAAFEPQLEEIAEPVERLDAEVTQLKSRIQELKLDERRLELSAEERRQRMAKLQERLNAVRNLREEAAVHAEIDIVRRALEADEQEALSLLDLIRRNEERLDDSSEQLSTAQAELAPRREEILSEQARIRGELETYQADRDAYFAKVPTDERRLYERIKAGGRDVVVAAMTDDGACGHCFAMVTLQLQNEVRAGARLIRCESCGVIVAPPLSEEEAAAEREAAAARAAEAAAREESLAEGADGDTEAEPEEEPLALPQLEPEPEPEPVVQGVVPTLPSVDVAPARKAPAGLPSLDAGPDTANANGETDTE